MACDFECAITEVPVLSIRSLSLRVHPPEHGARAPVRLPPERPHGGSEGLKRSG